MGRACSTYGERRDAFRVLMKKPDGRRPLGVDGRLILKWAFNKWVW
jgi:hypothetical protein